MRLQITRDESLRLLSFVLRFEAVGLVVALILAVVYAGLASSPLLDSFSLASFVIFLLVLFYAVLSGPGLFLSRPRLPPMELGSSRRGRRLLAPPQSIRDREFFELILYTGLAFLFLALTTGIGIVIQALGG